MTTLVIGARGSVGRRVLHQLIDVDEPVRASVRALTTADFPLTVPVVEADLSKLDTLDAALEGVEKVFLYPTTATDTAAFAAVAARADVQHVVLLPWTADNAIARHHRDIEAVLASSGLGFTPIRTLVLASNALMWATPTSRGEDLQITKPDSMTAPIHERDIAAVDAASLIGTAGAEVSDTLTGPELLSQRQQVAEIAAATKRAIGIQEITPEQAREQFSRFTDASTAAAIVEFVINADADAGGSPAIDTAEKIVGRTLSTFNDWVFDHLSDYTSAHN